MQITQFKRRGHFGWLLLSLLLLLLVSAVTSGHPGGDILIIVLIGLTLITGIYPLSHRKSFLLISGFFAMLTFTALWIAFFSKSGFAAGVSLIAGYVFFFYNAIVILLALLSRQKISFDDLAGAVSAYLLLGLSGAFVFAFFDLISPNSIAASSSVVPEAQSPHGLESLVDYIYFSFTCLTTLGFGDLVPVTAPTRVFAYLEAVIGQIYLTILVARLVGLHLVGAAIKQQ